MHINEISTQLEWMRWDCYLTKTDPRLTCSWKRWMEGKVTGRRQAKKRGKVYLSHHPLWAGRRRRRILKRQENLQNNERMKRDRIDDRKDQKIIRRDSRIERKYYETTYCPHVCPAVTSLCCSPVDILSSCLVSWQQISWQPDGKASLILCACVSVCVRGGRAV